MKTVALCLLVTVALAAPSRKPTFRRILGKGLSAKAIVAGEHNLLEVDGHEQTVAVSKIILHDDYDYSTLSNDVSIIYLSQPLTFNDRVQPIPLQDEREYIGNCVVSGWGRTSDFGSISSTLQYVDIPAVSDSNLYIGFDAIEDSMICAGVPEGGKGTCQGDAGRPLTCDGFLTGIVSWGYACAFPETPEVYAEVAYFRDWIKQNTK